MAFSLLCILNQNDWLALVLFVWIVSTWIWWDELLSISSNLTWLDCIIIDWTNSIYFSWTSLGVVASLWWAPETQRFPLCVTRSASEYFPFFWNMFYWRLHILLAQLRHNKRWHSSHISSSFKPEFQSINKSLCQSWMMP